MSYWQNLKIGVRLAIGIGSLLFLLAAVAGAAFVGLSQGVEHFATYRSLAGQTASVGSHYI